MHKGDGESAPDDGGLSLCSQCWAVRILPDDYFPRLINELTCHADSACLSGFATCASSMRMLNVLRRHGDETDWVEETVAYSACCDCRLAQASGLIHFIKS